VCEGHRLDGCEEEDAESVRQAVERVKQQIRWDKYSGCFDCGLPQAVCTRYEVREDGGYIRARGGRCQYPGVLIRLVVAIWGARSKEVGAFFEDRIRQSGIEWKDRDERALIKWMGRKVRWAGMESNEMCRAVVGLYDMCGETETE